MDDPMDAWRILRNLVLLDMRGQVTPRAVEHARNILEKSYQDVVEAFEQLRKSGKEDLEDLAEDQLYFYERRHFGQYSQIPPTKSHMVYHIVYSGNEPHMIEEIIGSIKPDVSIYLKWLESLFNPRSLNDIVRKTDVVKHVDSPSGFRMDEESPFLGYFPFIDAIAEQGSISLFQLEQLVDAFTPFERHRNKEKKDAYRNAFGPLKGTRNRLMEFTGSNLAAFIELYGKTYDPLDYEACLAYVKAFRTVLPQLTKFGRDREAKLKAIPVYPPFFELSQESGRTHQYQLLIQRVVNVEENVTLDCIFSEPTKKSEQALIDLLDSVRQAPERNYRHIKGTGLQEAYSDYNTTAVYKHGGIVAVILGDQEYEGFVDNANQLASISLLAKHKFNYKRKGWKSRKKPRPASFRLLTCELTPVDIGHLGMILIRDPELNCDIDLLENICQITGLQVSECQETPDGRTTLFKNYRGKTMKPTGYQSRHTYIGTPRNLIENLARVPFEHRTRNRYGYRREDVDEERLAQIGGMIGKTLPPDLLPRDGKSVMEAIAGTVRNIIRKYDIRTLSRLELIEGYAAKFAYATFPQEIEEATNTLIGFVQSRLPEQRDNLEPLRNVIEAAHEHGFLELADQYRKNIIQGSEYLLMMRQEIEDIANCHSEMLASQKGIISDKMQKKMRSELSDSIRQLVTTYLFSKGKDMHDRQKDAAELIKAVSEKGYSIEIAERTWHRFRYEAIIRDDDPERCLESYKALIDSSDSGLAGKLAVLPMGYVKRYPLKAMERVNTAMVLQRTGKQSGIDGQPVDEGTAREIYCRSLGELVKDFYTYQKVWPGLKKKMGNQVIMTGMTQLMMNQAQCPYDTELEEAVRTHCVDEELGESKRWVPRGINTNNARRAFQGFEKDWRRASRIMQENGLPEKDQEFIKSHALALYDHFCG
ncbi:MAG: hypothetical protein KJ709_02090 [Nanoarchaeota archaeon]|nr:hypothetical protein [Nanoarchaeota archaeon]